MIRSRNADVDVLVVAGHVDSLEAFANAAVRFCSDPQLRRRLSEAGRVHVRWRRGMPTVEGQLAEAIEDVRTLKPKALRGTGRIGAVPGRLRAQ
jgi:hypothetical protein